MSKFDLSHLYAHDSHGHGWRSASQPNHPDEGDDQSLPSLDLLSPDTHSVSGHGPFGSGNSFGNHGPSLVLFSTDEGAHPVHDLPHVSSSAGTGGTGGGTSSGGGTAAVTSAASQGLV